MIADSATDELLDRVHFRRFYGVIRRRKVIVGLAAILIVIAVTIGVVLGLRRSSATYDGASHDRFIAACTADGGEPVRDTCECIWEGIVSTIPFERFVRIDRELRGQAVSGKDLEMPDEIDSIREDCVSTT